MRGKTTLVRVVPRGEKILTLKAQGVLTKGSINEMREELYLIRRAIQYIIDALWELDELPSTNQCHQMFYKLLRMQRFRAHQAKQIYKYARALVKSVKDSGGKKPVLRKLTARLDKYDARVDLENQLVIIKLRNREFKIKLLHSRDYIKKFIGRKWYEVIISIDKRGRIWICIPFRLSYKPYKPRRILSLDINLKQLVFFDGWRFRRINTRFMEALYLKHLAEDVQKRHSYAWRRNKKWLEIIKAFHRRSRSIVVDWSRKFAKYIVLKARRTKSAIVLEDLEKLWFNSSRKSSSLADKLSRFAYRKLQLAILTKCIMYNVPVLFIDPRNTSTTCPRCRSKLNYVHRLAICPKCEFIADRDTIGAINIYLRALQALAPRHGSWGTHPMTNETQPKGGLPTDEPMTLYIKTYTSI